MRNSREKRVARAIALREKGLTETEIASRMGCSQSVISQYFRGTTYGRKYGVNFQAVIDSYLTGKTVKEVAEEFNISTGYTSVIISEHKRPRREPINLDDLRDLIESGATQSYTAEVLGISQPYVSIMVRKYRIVSKQKKD